MMELSDYRRGLFQWDTGRSLIVTEKDITEVHFQLLADGDRSHLTNLPFCGIISSRRKRSAFAGRDWRPADPALFLRKEKEAVSRLFSF